VLADVTTVVIFKRRKGRRRLFADERAIDKQPVPRLGVKVDGRVRRGRDIELPTKHDDTIGRDVVGGVPEVF